MLSDALPIAMDATILLWILAALLIVTGLVGLVVPALPGQPLLFGGLLMAAWIEDFAHVGAGTLVVLGLLAALSYLVDFAASALGAKRFGASPRAVLGAAAGALLGLFMGLIGVLVGPFVGAVVAELSLHNDWRQAGRAGVGASLGLLLGAAAKLALAFSMLGVYLLARFL